MFGLVADGAGAGNSMTLKLPRLKEGDTKLDRKVLMANVKRHSLNSTIPRLYEDHCKSSLLGERKYRQRSQVI